MSLRLLLVMGLALPLAACGRNTGTADTTTVTTTPGMTTTPGTGDPMMNDGTMMNDGMMDADDNVTVEGTISAAGDDLTRLPANTAVRNVNGWINRLNETPFEGSAGIVSDLETLRGQLQASPINGSAIGATLVRLGDATTRTAATAASSQQQNLRTLGGALTNTGRRLTGGA